MKRNRPRRRKWIRRLLWLAVSPLLLFALFLLVDWLFPLPLPQDRGARIVLAEDGTPLWRFADDNGVWRYPVSMNEVSPLYVEALLTYEDRWFYRHPGVNPLALMRAAWQNLSSQRVVSGGSTISMQVARLIEPHARTMPGKLRQIWRTLQLEWHLPKTEILTLYLNRAPYGGTLEGIAAASWAYLDKPPAQLTAAEAALLVVLPQSPTRLRPDRNPAAAQDARDKVLRRMAAYQVWPSARVKEALEEPVRLVRKQEPRLAPLLARRLSTDSAQASIRTTIDARLQSQLEAMLGAWKTRLPERTSGAIVVIEHQNMAVRAYLGSVDLDDEKRFGHVDMVQAVRSPGSTLKPFLYGMALDDGLIHSESLLQDTPRRYSDYRPENFSSGFAGPVSASSALFRSLNLPAVQLLEIYGPKRFAGQLRGAGLPLALPDAAQPNLAIILGGAGVQLEQLTAAYSIFARGGRLAQPRLLPQAPLSERRLLSPGAAWIVRSILAGHQPGQDANPLFNRRAALAWKTGTSYGFRDAWAIGVGPRYLIGVWIGRPDGTPVAGQFGAASATPLLLQTHDILLNRDLQQGILQPGDPQPESVKEATICWPLGQTLPPADPNCRRVRHAWTVNGITPPTLHTADQALNHNLLLTLWLDQTGKQVAADCPGARQRRIALWPAALEPWLPVREHRASRLPPVATLCPPRTPLPASPLVITGVRDGENLRLPSGSREHTLRLKVSALGGTSQRWWFLNGEPLQRTNGHEELAFSLQQRGQYQLSVLDEGGLSASVQFHLIE